MGRGVPLSLCIEIGGWRTWEKNIWSGHLKLIPPLIGGFPKERVFCSGIASLTWVLESMRCHLRLQTLRCSLLSARGLKRIQRRISFCCCLWNSEALVVTKWKNLEHSQKQPSIHIPTLHKHTHKANEVFVGVQYVQSCREFTKVIRWQMLNLTTRLLREIEGWAEIRTGQPPPQHRITHPKSNLDFVPFCTLLCGFACLSFHSASLHVDQFDLMRELGPSPFCANCDVYDWKQVVSQA